MSFLAEFSIFGLILLSMMVGAVTFNLTVYRLSLFVLTITIMTWLIVNFNGVMILFWAAIFCLTPLIVGLLSYVVEHAVLHRVEKKYGKTEINIPFNMLKFYRFVWNLGLTTNETKSQY